MQDVVIVAARRTAVGSFGGSLAGIPASDLGALVIKDIIPQALAKTRRAKQPSRQACQTPYRP